ncbi:MAG: (2Fe-2S)-binding protein [Rhodospirillales bacterium]|jgi:predicted molibdopterin-dependent oxidoreductase YjgC|nr:(2Fe-2S)-binding protein [Rhodospirillales bacterium]
MPRFRRTTPAQPLVPVTIDGRAEELPEGEVLAAALLVGGKGRFSDSVLAGEPRGPLCLMGSCFQCVAEIDGTPQVRTCRTAVRAGMTVVLSAPSSGSK